MQFLALLMPRASVVMRVCMLCPWSLCVCLYSVCDHTYINRTPVKPCVTSMFALGFWRVFPKQVESEVFGVDGEGGLWSGCLLERSLVLLRSLVYLLWTNEGGCPSQKEGSFGPGRCLHVADNSRGQVVQWE